MVSPGIRIAFFTLVFMAKTMNQTLILDEPTCISCAGCVAVCPHQALDIESLIPVIDQKSCTYCNICVRFCPVGALKVEKEG